MELVTSILLMGMKHSGKTTLGRLLCQQFRAEFTDLDDAILRRYDGPSDTIRDIYRSEGSDGFARLESHAAEMAANRFSGTLCIVSLGGGTIDNRAAMENLSPLGRFVYLREAEDILFKRIMRKGLPPFLSVEDPEGSFHSLYERRDALYQRAADLVVQKHGTSVEEAFDTLVQQLEEAGFARK